MHCDENTGFNSLPLLFHAVSSLIKAVKHNRPENGKKQFLPLTTCLLIKNAVFNPPTTAILNSQKQSLNFKREQLYFKRYN